MARALLTGVVLCAGCQSPPSLPLQRYEFSSPHMGTLFHYTFYAPDQQTADAAAAAAAQRVTELDDRLSDYKADSELNELCTNAVGRPVPVSSNLFDVLQRAEEMAALTDGAFDPTVGPLVRLWRFSHKRHKLPTREEISDAQAAVGWRKLTLDARARTVTLLAPAMRLDLGGIAKGYAAGEALSVLKNRGLNRAMVAASGDIALGDPPPGAKGWRVGLGALGERESPMTEILFLRNCGVSTSGDTEQFIEINGVRYSHIVNPVTGLGLTERIQVTIIAPDATTSDALATAVCVMGAGQGMAVVESQRGLAAKITVPEGAGLRVSESTRWMKLSGKTDAW